MKKIIILAGALIAAAGAGATITDPSAAGALERGAAMLSEGNARGCLDRLATIAPGSLHGPQAEEAAWLGALATYRGGLPDAAAALEAYLEKYPASPRRYEARLYLADALLATDAPRALAILTSLAATDPGTALGPDLRYHLGYAMMRLGDFEDARREFATVESDGTYGADARFYIGYIAYSERDYDTAIGYFRRTDRTSLPGSGTDYYLAQIYYIRGDYDKALKAAQSLIDNPACTDETFRAEALRIAGESYFQKGDTRRAIDMLEQYAAVAPLPELSALYILGTACYNRGETAKAVKYLEPVTVSDSAMGQSAYLFIGQALMAEGDRDAALMAFDAALRSDHDEEVREAAYYNYAVAKFGGGTVPFGSSVATFEDFLRRYPAGPYTPAVQEYLVAGYLTDSDYDTALESIRRMQSPGDKVLAAKQRILYALGNRALGSGDPDTAIALLEEADGLSSHDRATAARVNLSLGEALYRSGDYAGAIDRISRYRADIPAGDPNEALSLYDLGYAHFGAKDYAAAREAFSRFTAQPGTSGDATVADALNRLGDAALYTGDLDGAYRSYGESARRAPEMADYPLFQQAVILGYRRDYTGEAAAVDALTERFPTSALIPEALLEKAEAYIQLGRRDDAIEVYRRVTETYPATAQGRRGLLQMAMLTLSTGDREAATEAYRSVVTRYPTSDEALVAVEELQRIAAQDGTLGQLSGWLAGIENAPRPDIAETDRLAFEAAEVIFLDDGSTARLERYLTDYPAGAYRQNAWGYMMEAADGKGHSRDALQYAELIITNYPDTRLAEEAMAVKAAALHSTGSGTESMIAWEELARRAGSPAMQNRARTGIMRVALDLGDWERAIAAADALLASSTAGAEDRNEATFVRGMALDGRGDSEAARDVWGQIAGMTDDINGVKSAYYLAQSLFDVRDYKGARAGAEAIIDSGTPHLYWLARAFVLLSDVFAAEGKKFEAREYLRSLRENYPGTETDIFQMIDIRLSNL